MKHKLISMAALTVVMCASLTGCGKEQVDVSGGFDLSVEDVIKSQGDGMERRYSHIYSGWLRAN